MRWHGLKNSARAINSVVQTTGEFANANLEQTTNNKQKGDIMSTIITSATAQVLAERKFEQLIASEEQSRSQEISNGWVFCPDNNAHCVACNRGNA